MNEDLARILRDQRDLFASDKTIDVNYRINNLKKLRSLILGHEDELSEAMRMDLHKPYFEVLGTESRYVVAEISMMLRNMRRGSGRWFPGH